MPTILTLVVMLVLAMGCSFAFLPETNVEFIYDYNRIRSFNKITFIRFGLREPRMTSWSESIPQTFRKLSRTVSCYIHVRAMKRSRMVGNSTLIDKVGVSVADECLFASVQSDLYIAFIEGKGEVVEVLEILQKCNKQTPSILIFLSYFILENIGTLPLPVNNKIVFAVPEENGRRLRLLDFYRVLPNASLHPTVIGIWSERTANKFTAVHPRAESCSKDSENQLLISDFNIFKLRTNLTGLFIRCSVIPNGRYLELRNSSDGALRIDGTVGYIWNELHRMLNFSYECKQPLKAEYGMYDKATNMWNGQVRGLMDNEFDITLSLLDVTYQRALVIDYLYPFGYIPRNLVMKKEFFIDAHPWKRYVNEFAPLVWLVWSVSLLCLFFVFRTITKLHPLEQPYFGSDCFIALVSPFLNTGSEYQLRSWSGRMFFFTVFLTAILLYTHYTSVMISFLMVDNYLPPFTTLDGLLTSHYQFRIMEGTSDIDLFKESSVPVFQRIWKDKLEPYREDFPETLKKLKLLIKKSDYTILVAPHEFTGLDIPCSYHQIHVIKIPVSWAVQKNNPVKDIFSYHIGRIKETGVYAREEQRHELRKNFQATLRCPSTNPRRPIELHNVYFVFLLLLVGMVLSLIFLLYEICSIGYSRGRKVTQHNILYISGRGARIIMGN